MKYEKHCPAAVKLNELIKYNLPMIVYTDLSKDLNVEVK